MKPTLYTPRQINDQAYVAENIDLVDRVSGWPGCWEWQGKINNKGYGRSSQHEGRSDKAYRVSFNAFVGEIPTGLEPDHLCYNKICVNPDHLELVTRRENVLRSIAHHKALGTGSWNRGEMCGKGLHPMDDANIYAVGAERTKYRRCKACARVRYVAYIAAHPERVAMYEATRRAKIAAKRNPRPTP